MSQLPGKRILTKTIDAELELINAMQDNTKAYAETGNDDSARKTYNEAAQQATQAIHRLRHLIVSGEPTKLHGQATTPENISQTAAEWRAQATDIRNGRF